MTKPEELLLKHLPIAELAQGTSVDRCRALGDLLLSHPTDPSFVGQLASLATHVHVSHRRVSALGVLERRLPTNASLATHPLRFDRPFDNAVLLLENGRGIARALLTTILQALRPGGSLFAIAAVRAGARTFQDDAEALGPTETIYAGSAHRLFRLTRTDAPPTPPADWEQPWSTKPLAFSLRGQHYHLFTQPGVFSQSKVDDGTAFLLDHFPKLQVPPNPAILDACCGNGILGLVAQTEWQAASLTLADDDILAIDCARQALIASNLPPCLAHATDLTRSLPGAPGTPDRFDLILCNPPFHQGHAEDRSFVQRFAPLAAHALARFRRDAPSQLVLIANRFLPYEQDLTPHFKTVTTLSSDSRYRVLVAVEPRNAAQSRSAGR